MQGVLTIHLIRCVNLVGENPNTYVRMIVADDDTEQVGLEPTTGDHTGFH